MVFGLVVWLIPFPHQSRDSNVKLRLFVFSFGCFVLDNLFMALSSSEVMLSHNWFTGIDISIFFSKLVPNSDMCFFGPFQLALLKRGICLGSAYFSTA